MSGADWIGILGGIADMKTAYDPGEGMLVDSLTPLYLDALEARRRYDSPAPSVIKSWSPPLRARGWKWRR